MSNQSEERLSVGRQIGMMARKAVIVMVAYERSEKELRRQERAGGKERKADIQPEFMFRNILSSASIIPMILSGLI